TLVLGLYLPLALTVSDVRSLDNPNLLPLPLALYFASIVLYTESRHAALSIVAAVALAAGVSADLIGLILVPFHLALVAVRARRPVGAVAASSLVLALALWLDSPETLGAIVERLLALPAGIVLGIAAVLVASAIRSLRRRGALETMSTRVRTRTVTAAMLV